MEANVAYQAALSYRHDRVASIPLMAYQIPLREIEESVDDGYFFMKIKIGQPGTQRAGLPSESQEGRIWGSQTPCARLDLRGTSARHDARSTRLI